MTATTPVLTTAEKLRKLHWNTALAATNSIYAQLVFFGSAFVLFLNEIGFTNTEIGFLLSLLPFTGIVAPLIAPMVARFGYKKTFIVAWIIRKLITMGLLLVPLVLASAGTTATLLLVSLVVAGFALSRAIAETGWYPWAQEFIPHHIRGRYAAVNDIAGRLTGIVAVGVASAILALPTGLDRFMLMFAIGIVFGWLAVWSAAHIPGGAPVRDDQEIVSYRSLPGVLRDKNFLTYVAGLGLLIIGATPMMSFLPLYMEQQIGLDTSRVVLLSIGTLLGGLATTYLLGWAADRYGSKPVMLTGLYIRIILPIAWALMPRNSDASLPIAVVIAVIWGSAEIAWIIGSARLLYVRVVPQDRKAEYMAVYYAIVGLIGGLSQVWGGRLLDLTAGLSGQFLIFTIDPFFPLFALAFVLSLASAYFFVRVQGDSLVSMGEFAGMFTHGNPVIALESLFRYYRARDERETVVMTERMGQTKSPLTVDELLEALHDPRFNVRFEAIISIARMERDPRLVESLCEILDGTELSLSVISAWALGRIGDERALVTLRGGLNSPYRSIRAHCARALGTLRDTSIAPLLHEWLQAEDDKGLQIAYASALGNLRWEAAVPTLMNLLHETENGGARLELALALARVVGDEQHFIKLLRQMRGDKGTALSQAVTALRKRYGSAAQPEYAQCADAFARDDFESGVALLLQLIAEIPSVAHTPAARAILTECMERLAQYGVTRVEYVLLALHTLEA